MFRADVARGRGRGVMTLTGPAWEGRIVGAQDAKRAGLVDRIGTFTEAVGRAAALAKKGR
jgi:ClpP class serine protease